MSTFHPLPTGGERGIMLQQAIATYTWDGETTNGMIERSSYTDLIEEM